MGEKPVGGLIAIIAVALLSVVTFGLVATNQANRDAQVVEVTVSTSEDVVNAGENVADNPSSSSIGVAESADSNDESSDSDSELNEPTNKNMGNFQSRGQQSESNTEGSETESDEGEPIVLDNDSDEEEQSSPPVARNNGNNARQEIVENNNSSKIVEESEDNTGDEPVHLLSTGRSSNPPNNDNNNDDPIISVITGEELNESDLPSCGNSGNNGPREDCSSVLVSAQCINGVATFTITNTGDPNEDYDPGEGDMKYASEWRLYYDGEQYPFRTGEFQLAGGETLVITHEDGGEVRFEADQLAYHPGNSEPRETLKCSEPVDPEPDPDKVCHATVAPMHPTLGKYQGKHAIYLRGLGADYVPVNPDGLEWNVYGDTVVLEGMIKHRTDATKVFYAEFEMSGKQAESGKYSGSAVGPKTDEMESETYDPIVNGGGGIDPETWYFYSSITGVLTGYEALDGVVIEITGNGPFFQVGYGANLKNLQYGAATWFNYEVVEDPSQIYLGKTGKGDINVDLLDCAPPQEQPEVILKLTAECLANGELWWRVRNASGVETPYRWEHEAGFSGDGIAAAGEVGVEVKSYFTSGWDDDGSNTTKIFWTNPATGQEESTTKSHNSWPCVGHVEFEKVWENTNELPELALGIKIEAESSVATATCTYNDLGEFGCEYLPKDGYPHNSIDDLHVPFGETYTVTETGVTGGWSAVLGADDIEYYNVLGLLEGFIYDIDEDVRYCEHDPQTQEPYEKYCVHTVVNQYIPQEFVCDSLYYVNHVDNNQNDSPLFLVNIVDDKANLTQIGNFDFDQVHIGASLDGKWMYGVAEEGEGIQILDLDLTDGDQSEAPNGVAVTDEMGNRVRGITQVAFSPNGKLYIGSDSTDKIYEVVDVANSKVVSLGKITKFDSTATVNIGGADIAFGANGEFYVMTRADKTIYQVDLNTMVGTPITSPGKSTGLAIDDEGAGNFIYSDTSDNTVVVINRNSPYDELGRYEMYFNGSPYSAVWGDMSGGCMEALPDPVVDIEIDKVSSVDDVEVGETFVYTIEVWNNGPDTATNVKVLDELPPQVEFFGEDALSTTAGSCGYNGDLNAVECFEIPELAPGLDNVITIEFTVKAIEVGTAHNEAVVTSNEDDDEDDDEVKITDPPPTDACIADLGAQYYENYTSEYDESIDSDRRIGNMALGLPTPEAGNQSGHINFASLGVGGSIDLYFDGVIYDDAGEDFYVYETSWGHRFSPCEAYPETIIAEILFDGGWHPLDGQSTCRTGGFDISGVAPYAEAVRLIDITEPGYASDGDGFDVDGVICAEPPKPDPDPEPNPDYACIATAILDYAPGTTKNGGTIPANRTVIPPESDHALTIENDDTLNFISLGYGDGAELGSAATTGWVIYDFGEGNVIKNVDSEDDLIVVETSWGDKNRPWENYKEQAEVYASQDLETWVHLGTDRKDMTFDLGDLDWARYIMLVDTTPSDSKSGDGFDIDGLGAMECGEPPVPPPSASCLAFEAVEYAPVNPENIEDGRDEAWQAEAINPDEFDTPPVNFAALGGEGGYIVLEPTDGVLYVDVNPVLYVWETTYGEGTQHKTCASYYEIANVEVRQGDGPWVPAYPIVGEDNVGSSICRDGGVDLLATGLDYVSAVRITDAGSTTPDGYDVDGLSCVPYEPEPEEPPYDVCDMLFYSHNADKVNESVLYTVYLNEGTGMAEMYLLDDDTGFGDSHIASNADGSKLYLIENKAPYRLGIYDVDTKVMTDVGSTGINGVTQAAVHPETGVLYVGSSNTDLIYTVNTANAQATTLGEIKIDGNKVNINGADIAFGSDGTFYLATRTTNKIYEVDLDTMTIVATVASNTEMNGMTIEDFGRGNFVYASRAANAFVSTDGTTSTSFGADAYGESFDIQWGDMASCIDYDEPDEPEDPPLDPPEQCDALFNHVKNGSFEEPVVTHNKNWDVYTSSELPGWHVDWNMPAVACDGNTEAVLELQNSSLNLATPVDGNQYAELDSDCGGPSNRQGGEVTTTISQIIKTKPGKTYRFEFDARARRNTMDFVAMWDGVEVVNQTLDTTWEHFSVEIVATGEITEISFRDDGTADSFGVFLDAVGVFEECEDENPNPDGQICIALDEFATGQSVEGMGVLHPDMSLTTTSGQTVALHDGELPTTYGAPNGGDSRPSGCLVDGFGEISPQASRLHDYVFEFADGKIVKDFSLTMFDYGDFNKSGATSHTIKLVGYDAGGNVVAEDVLTYDSSNATNPRTSDFGNLYLTGDACTGDADGEIGVYDFNIANTEGIQTVKVLYENNGTNTYGGDRPSDPNIAFGEICFEIEDVPPPPPPPPPPETDVCETIFHAFNPTDSSGTDLYSIYINDDDVAEVTLLEDETGFANSHIAASNDGSTIYLVENVNNGRLGLYDIETGVITVAGNTGISGVTMAAVHPETGVLYLGNPNNEKIFTIDVTAEPIDTTAVDLGQITHNGATLPLNGSDIVFDADGNFYVGTNNKDKIFLVDLDTMTTLPPPVVNIGHNINGLAIDEEGKGQFIYTSQNKSYVTRTDGTTFVNYNAEMDGETFTFGNGDLSTSCVDAPPPPPPPPTVCEVGTGLGIASDFNVFVLGDMTSQYSDTGGRLAIGGNGSLDGYGVGFELGDEWNGQDTLIVGGDLTFSNGQVFKGNVAVGGTANLAANANILNGTLSNTMPIDFGAAATELEGLSALYASYAANGSATLEYSTLKLVGTDPDLNVFDVDGADIQSASSLTIDVPDGSLVVINVSGESVSIQNMGLENGIDAGYILYNLYEATSLTMSGIGLHGSVLAPYADLQFNNGQAYGTLVVASFTGGGEPHVGQFEGCIEEPEEDPTVDLELTKTAVSSTVHVGDEFSFTLVGTNHGPEVAGILLDEGTVITDYLPTNAEFVSADWIKGSMTGTCTEDGGVLTCDVGTLEVMETVTATVNFVATELGTVDNTARIDPAIPEDSDPSNNEDDDSVDVVDECEYGGDPEAHLSGSIQKYISGTTDNYNQDGTSEWKGTVTNSSENCAYEVGMAAYEKHNGGALNLQVLYDSDPDEPIDGWDTGDLPEDDPSRIVVEPGESIMLFVTAPACATQLDLFYDASHLGVYENYDQANADLPPLVLPQFQSNDWGSQGNTYGPRLLAAKHINNDNDCAGPILSCEELQVSIPENWMMTEYSTDNSTWMSVDGTIDVAPVYIVSSFSSNPKRVEYWMDGQRLHTENSSPYYAMGDNKAWTPANDGDLVIRAYHKTENCYVDQVVPVVAPEVQELVVQEAYQCPMTVMIGDEIVTDNGNITYDLTEAVQVVSIFSEGTSVSRVRYYVDGSHVDDENSSPYYFLGDNGQLTLSQAQGWAGDDGEFLLFVAAEKDGEVCSSVNIKVTVGQD